MHEYCNKTVLITGATGLIGNNLVDHFLKQKNVRVIALSRSKEKLQSEFSEYRNDNNFEFIAQDISFPLTIDEPIDFIFHAAGSMESKIIHNYPVDIIKPNILGVINCLEFLKMQKQTLNKTGKLILFSSVTVYGNNTSNDLTVCENNTNYTESLDSIGAPYSQTKRIIEVITNSYVKQYGINAVIARLSTVYGPTRLFPDTAFYEFIKKGLSGDIITVNSSNLPKRDNLYIDDAINGLCMIGLLGNKGEVFNISSNGDLGNFASVDQIARLISNIAGNKFICKNSPSIERKPGLKLNNDKLKKLGWKVTVSLEDGIRKTLHAMKHIDENI